MRARKTTLLLLPIIACLAGASLAAAGEPDTLFQVSVIGSISGGVYDGALDLGSLAEHGDFGLGATHALGGELVALGSKFYEFGIDGRARLLPAGDTVPFATVTFFDPEASISVEGDLTQQEIEAKLLELIENPSVIHAVSVSGRFSHVKTRTPARQAKPYRPLAEALANQAEHDFYDVQGTMVGFWTPEYLANIHSPGFHFHFVADEGYAGADGAQGGHVLAYRAEGVELAVDAQERLEIWFPTEDPDFRNLDL